MSNLDRVVQDLVIANRILAREDVVDAYGHVSIRNPDRPERFFLSRSRAPELVERDDILELGLDGQPVRDDERALYLERFIHAAIYEARPDINAVVHAHAEDVLPFGITRATPLRPVVHSGSFIGVEVPDRCKYYRVILGELARIADHFTCNGASAMELGAFTPFLWILKVREWLWDILERETGARMMHSFARIGGMAAPPTETFAADCREILPQIDKVVAEAESLLLRNRIFMDRTQNIGVLSKELALANYELIKTRLVAAKDAALEGLKGRTFATMLRFAWLGFRMFLLFVIGSWLIERFFSLIDLLGRPL